MGAYGPYGISAHILFLAGNMTLLPVQHIAPVLRICPALQITVHQIGEAPSRHHFRSLHPGQLQEGGGQVGEADEIIQYPARVFHSFAPSNGQGHSGPRVIIVGFASREGHAIVACDHYQGVFQFPVFLQHPDGIPHQ